MIFALGCSTGAGDTLGVGVACGVGVGVVVACGSGVACAGGAGGVSEGSVCACAAVAAASAARTRSVPMRFMLNSLLAVDNGPPRLLFSVRANIGTFMAGPVTVS